MRKKGAYHMIIKNGKVLVFEEGGFVPKDIRVEGGRIREVAPSLQPQAGEEIYDAAGKYVTPGLIDAHSHICISEEGMGAIGDDCCDYSGALTPELEVLDAIYPFDRAVMDSIRAGVTAACVCPGRPCMTSTFKLSNPARIAARGGRRLSTVPSVARTGVWEPSAQS